MKQIARLIKQFQLKSKIFHFDYAHRGSNTHKHQLDKKKKKRRTKYHMCVWLAIDLCTFAYQKLNAVKSLAHSNCISCHLVEIAWLLLLLLLILLHSDPPARSSGNGCVHIAGSPDLRYTRLLAVTLSCLAVWAVRMGTWDMQSYLYVSPTMWECPWACVFPRAGQTASTSTPTPKPALNWGQLLLHDTRCQNMNSNPNDTKYICTNRLNTLVKDWSANILC